LWAPKGQPAVYKGPHKPHTRLKDLRAKHAAHADWREVIVDDKHLRSESIQARPGSRTRRALHPDTRAWWVVMDDEMKFDIESVGPASGRKGSIIQVPMQTFYSWEVVGNQPALVFETNIAGAKTLYESTGAPAEKPPAGTAWIPVKSNNREIGVYTRNNKPQVHYDEWPRQSKKAS